MNNTAQIIPRMTAEEYFKHTAGTTQPQELLEGVIVDQAAPSIRHQSIVGALYSELRQFIKLPSVCRSDRCQTR